MSDLGKDMMKAFGDAWGDDSETVNYRLDTGFPPLNKVITGSYSLGIPLGKMIEIYGPSSSGKTAIATQLMLEAQRQGGAAIFLDMERSFKPELAAKMGLRIEPPYFVWLKPKTWEKANTAGVNFAKMIRESGEFKPDAPVVIVLDSIAASIPESSFGKELDAYNMNDTTALARATSTTLKVIKAFAEELKFTVLYLNQIRTKPGVVYGDPTTTPGGGATEFYADARIALGRKVDKDKGGQIIKAKVVKNKIDRPFGEAEWSLKFPDDGGIYFDVIGSMVDYLCEIGALNKSGAWIEWTDGKKYNRQPLVDALEKAKAIDKLIDLLPKPPSS